MNKVICGRLYKLRATVPVKWTDAELKYLGLTLAADRFYEMATEAAKNGDKALHESHMRAAWRCGELNGFRMHVVKTKG